MNKADSANPWVSTKNNVFMVQPLLSPLLQGNTAYLFSEQGLNISNNGVDWTLSTNYPTTKTQTAAVDNAANIYAIIESDAPKLFYSNDKGINWLVAEVPAGQ